MASLRRSVGLVTQRLRPHSRTLSSLPKSDDQGGGNTVQAYVSDRRALDPLDEFEPRHMGPSVAHQSEMLGELGFESLEALVSSTVPKNIRLEEAMKLSDGVTEAAALKMLKDMVGKNKVMKSFIGMGYSETETPKIILRNMLENPGWYTAYTPYQAEISQGRLEMLLNYQTLVTELTGLPVANASLLDEATAAAEAMSMCVGLSKNGGGKKKKADVTFFADSLCHPQTLSVLKTRCDSVGVTLKIADLSEDHIFDSTTVGVLFQYPDTYGAQRFDPSDVCQKAKDAGALAVVAADPLALTVLKAPGDFGADIAIGSMQRYGVPMGFGGPHAAFMATTEKFARRMPGRIIGETVEANERKGRALRMAMQTREQHIRRDKATSNICTAQALLANMAAAYAIYHGADGLKSIAERCHAMAMTAQTILKTKYDVSIPDFDTFVVKNVDATKIAEKAASVGMNVRIVDPSTVGLSFGETVTKEDLAVLLAGAFDMASVTPAVLDQTAASLSSLAHSPMARPDAILERHPVFRSHHSETQMLRYLRNLEGKDLSLNHSMISLGSCTMKLNATSEMIPVTWPEICNMHPFAPKDQTVGYVEMIADLSDDLAKITGFDAVSVQPNSGASGEYAGLLAIREYQKSIGEGSRDVCLIPVSAHGTNPASAVMAGLRVVTVQSDEKGNVDLDDFTMKCEKYSNELSSIMITYPSTYGVFEEKITDLCDVTHQHGGLVYMDGANLNAQCGLTSPGKCGADVCHLNMHKTFCIPHGGGGPGVGAIGVTKQLAPFLPSHDVSTPFDHGGPPVAAAQFGSAAILPISWMYVKMLGGAGLTRASAIAILNANYLAKKLSDGYDVLFRGVNGQCAHEFIVDLRPFKSSGVSEEDVAKRLQDFGFHSPTMSWPVPGTLMIEPTESEDKAELDRFADAMLTIRDEIQQVQDGTIPYDDSPLKHAPHTLLDVTSSTWNRKYSRETAAFPMAWIRNNKFWPTVGRVDNVHGDRNLICTCPPVDSYSSE